MSFEFPVRVYWEDTDAGGIVFYANYLKFFERARTEWLFVVVETQLKYHKPAQLDDLLTVNASMLNKGRSSLVITQQAWRQATEPVLLCEGTIRIGWVQAASLKPDRIPPSILERLI
jgi:acyl-CoA thioester hydrolase